MSAVHDARSVAIDDELVARYLCEHPDFFARHPRLLAEISLPHDAGRAISLIERQVSLLRERNQGTRKRLAQLVDAAVANERVFEKTRALTLELLDARTSAELDAALERGLRAAFGADDVACHCTFASSDDPPRTGGASLGEGASLTGGASLEEGESLEEGASLEGGESHAEHASCAAGAPLAEGPPPFDVAGSPRLVWHAAPEQLPLPKLMRSLGTTCGTLRAKEYARLFRRANRAATAIDSNEDPSDPSKAHGSAAIAAFSHRGLAGLLAIGSRDPGRFSADMGPLFVRSIADVLARVLLRLIPVHPSP